MSGRKIITKDMLIAACEKGWHLSLTANHYGVHRKSISDACERFGVVLPVHKFSSWPQGLSQSSKALIKKIEAEDKPKVKLSASPAAIQRTLRRLQNEKRLQAQN